MTWSDLPSLNSLRAFATVAETGSYTQAGTTLNVSHAAVSQQVKALEARLGMTLVTREGRGVKLTEEGAVLARDLGKGFDTIRKGVEVVTGVDATRPVQFTMSPAFAVSLTPRRAVEGVTDRAAKTAALMVLGCVSHISFSGHNLRPGRRRTLNITCWLSGYHQHAISPVSVDNIEQNLA